MGEGQYFGEQEIIKNLKERLYKAESKSEKLEVLLLKKDVIYFHSNFAMKKFSYISIYIFIYLFAFIYLHLYAFDSNMI